MSCAGFVEFLKLEVEGKVKQNHHVQLARDREDSDFYFFLWIERIVNVLRAFSLKENDLRAFIND